jgi:peptidyl-prolyl cis-trans isomerase SurA
MRRWITTAAMLLGLLPLPVPGPGLAQEVTDRIVARVETEIILLSDIRQLSRYQVFLDGKSQSDADILNLLIDQWIVRNEATVARFPKPSDDDVNRSIERLKRSFASPEEFQVRQKNSGITDEEIRQFVGAQLYLSNYLDSRFRPAIQIDEKAIEEFYKSRVVPRAESRGQTPPTLDTARDFIQEALVQQAINEQADRWLKESRTRVRVEIMLDEKPK